LPFTDDFAHIYRQLNIPPEIWNLQGRKGLYSYFRAFFMDDWCHAKEQGVDMFRLRAMAKEAKKAEKDFWFMLLPSGFPKGEI